MRIAEYEPKYENAVKDLLEELQYYLAELDERGVLICKETFRDGYFEYSMRETQKHNGKIFIAEENGGVVGVLVCKVLQGEGEAEFTTSCPKIGFISDISVTEAARSKGIGRKLMAAAEKYFSNMGCDYLQLEVFAPNARAAAFYKRLGFEVNCYYMSKAIPSKK